MKIITKHIQPAAKPFRIDQAIQHINLSDMSPGKMLVYTTSKKSDPDKNGTSVVMMSQTKIDDTAVDALKASLQKQMQMGCECPVCGQSVKVYSRTINSTMAKALVIFYKKVGDTGMHLFDAFRDEKDPTIYRGDFAKLRFWGLIKEVTGLKANGRWILTKKGKDFVEGIITVPKYVYVYNNTIQSVSPEMIGIREAFKNPFDFEDIMGTKRNSILNTLVTDDIALVRRDGTNAY